MHQFNAYKLYLQSYLHSHNDKINFVCSSKQPVWISNCSLAILSHDSTSICQLASHTNDAKLFFLRNAIAEVRQFNI